MLDADMRRKAEREEKKRGVEGVEAERETNAFKRE